MRDRQGQARTAAHAARPGAERWSEKKTTWVGTNEHLCSLAARLASRLEVESTCDHSRSSTSPSPSRTPRARLPRHGADGVAGRARRGQLELPENVML